MVPSIARIVFVAASVPEDAALHKGLSDLGVASVRALNLPELRLIAHTSGTPETHPVYGLLLDAAIEDAAQYGFADTQRLLLRGTGRRLTRTELERARRRAEDIGRLGEELLNGHFSYQAEDGSIQSCEWVANDNAISPFDFWLYRSATEKRKVEVKSTTGDFKQIMHISLSELYEMRDSLEPYDLYRIYSIDDRTAKLRVAENVKTFAVGIVNTLESLPHGITADGISVKPETIDLFGPEQLIELPAVLEEYDE